MEKISGKKISRDILKVKYGLPIVLVSSVQISSCRWPERFLLLIYSVIRQFSMFLRDSLLWVAVLCAHHILKFLWPFHLHSFKKIITKENFWTHGRKRGQRIVVFQNGDRLLNLLRRHSLKTMMASFSAHTYNCYLLMKQFSKVCQDLGVPISFEKTEGRWTFINLFGLFYTYCHFSYQNVGK